MFRISILRKIAEAKTVLQQKIFLRRGCSSRIGCHVLPLKASHKTIMRRREELICKLGEVFSRGVGVLFGAMGWLRQADISGVIFRERVVWRFIARRDCRSGSTGNDHLPYKPEVHREPAIRIPAAPDASASTVTALAPAQIVVRTVSVRLMSSCLRKPVVKTMHPAAIRGSWGKYKSAHVSGFRDRGAAIRDRKIHT